MGKNKAVSSMRVPPGFVVTFKEGPGLYEFRIFIGVLDEHGQNSCYDVPEDFSDRT